MALMQAVESLLEQDFQPQRTLYLAFGHDEEQGGENGAARIAQLLRSRGIQFEFILDEGLIIADGMVPGVNRPVALIGTAEKGVLNLDLSVHAPGGHSSQPPRQTAIGILARAISRIEDHPFPARLDGPTRRLLEVLAPDMSFPMDWVASVTRFLIS